MRIAVGAALVFAVIIVGSGAASSFSSSRENDPGYDSMASKLAGTKCKFFEDSQGIAHVHAEDELAAIACAGWVQAKDRGFQMDYFRRMAEGRSAEVLGKDMIRSDFIMRLVGLREHADALYEKMNPEERERWDAFAVGANHGFASAREVGNGYEGYEFRELGYHPRPWSGRDSLAVLMLESFDQTRQSFGVQIQEEGQKKHYGADASSLFARDGVPWDTSILKPGEYSPKIKTTEIRPKSAPSVTNWALNAKKFFSDFPALKATRGEGSNNWVVSPSRSATGNAWFANDPHLDLKHPPFWKWVHITVEHGGNAGTGGTDPYIDMIGAMLPGTPVIASGTNRHVAWGLTNSYLDAGRIYAVSKAEVGPLQSFRPKIWFKILGVKLPFVFKTYTRTAEGWPILPIEGPKGKVLVVRWTGYDLDPSEISPLFGLATVKNATEINETLSRVGVPSWNYVFADDQGSIGYRAIGRTIKNESVPAFGFSTGYDRQEATRILSPEEMPHSLNPKRGYLATANNRQWPSDSKYFPGRGHANGMRAFRIEELLRGTSKHDLKSLQRTQCDVQVTDARFILAPLLKHLARAMGNGVTDIRLGKMQSGQKQALDALTRWDLAANEQCEACGIYRRWTDRLMDAQNLNYNALFHVITQETLNPDLAKSLLDEFNAALKDLKIDGAHPLPRWGAIHLASFSHLLGRRFDATPIGTPGDDETVNVGSSDWVDGHYNHVEGASQRLIVEMSQPPKVYQVLAGSNSNMEKRDLTDSSEGPAGEWQRWLHCQLRQREFPVEWSELKTSDLIL